MGMRPTIELAERKSHEARRIETHRVEVTVTISVVWLSGCMYVHTHTQLSREGAPYFTHTIIDWWRKGTQLKISTVQAQYSYSHSFDSCKG